ncbi:MAG: hypothetical protein AB4368_21760 [Xenococcaceae cyanobacterium]
MLLAGKGDDALYGDAGSDRLIASAGNDLLFGGSGDDALDGGKGDDNLIGGEGNDTLIGLSGSNTLTGDDGSDLFILSLDGTDIITDFTSGEDLLKLPETISFVDLEISKGQGDEMLIQAVGSELAIFQGINADSLDADNFVFT